MTKSAGQVMYEARVAKFGLQDWAWRWLSAELRDYWDDRAKREAETPTPADQNTGGKA